jgi:hypothetical protein
MVFEMHHIKRGKEFVIEFKHTSVYPEYILPELWSCYSKVINME